MEKFREDCMKSKCVCGYEGENFLKVQIFRERVILTEDWTCSCYGIIACPKCKTLKLEERLYEDLPKRRVKVTLSD